MADQNSPDFDQSSTLNTREAMLSLSIDERIDRLSYIIRHQIALALDVKSADIEDDVPFEVLNPIWEKPLMVYPVVAEAIEETLERTFYRHEFNVKPTGSEERNTIRRLATYLAKGMEISIPTNTFADPYEEGNWAWGETEGLSSDREPISSATFILTSARAGSTLLRTMLAGHPDLLVPPELNLLEFDSMAARRKLFDATGYTGFTTGLGHALEMTGATAEEAAQRLERFEAEDTSIQQVYQILHDLSGQRMLVDKSPIYSLRPACLQRAEQLFDQPKYLLLIRHPYAVIESMVRMRFHNTVVGNHLGIWDESPWLFAEKWWAASYRNTTDFFKSIPSERQHTVYFESLVTDPEKVLSDVCTFLGIPFHRVVMDPFAAERRLDGIGDPNLRASSRIDPGLAAAWKTKRPPHQLSPFTQRVAQELGYAL